jgi:DHA2 family multidrug resistance protein
MLGFGLAMFGTISILSIFVQGLLGFSALEAGYLFMPRDLAAGVPIM